MSQKEKDPAEKLMDIYEQVIDIVKENNLDCFVVLADFTYALDKARSARKVL